MLTPKYSVEECKDRDATYSAPLYIKAEFMNLATGEVKQQTLFMGDFPLMTEAGTFVINGTERVVVFSAGAFPPVLTSRRLRTVPPIRTFTLPA